MDVGDRFSHYRLEAEVGRAGTGVVYAAHDEEHERRVALKILAAELSDDAAYRARFLDAARAVAQLSSPHVVPVHTFGLVQGRLYLDMALAEGGDVAALLARGPIAPERAVGIVEQVAEALDDAHDAGLVHGDMTAGNVLLTRRRSAGDVVYLSGFAVPPSVPVDRSGDVKSLAELLCAAVPGGPAGLQDVVARASAAGRTYVTAGELARAARSALDGQQPTRAVTVGRVAEAAGRLAAGRDGAGRDSAETIMAVPRVLTTPSAATAPVPPVPPVPAAPPMVLPAARTARTARTAPADPGQPRRPRTHPVLVTMLALAVVVALGGGVLAAVGIARALPGDPLVHAAPVDGTPSRTPTVSPSGTPTTPPTTATASPSTPASSPQAPPPPATTTPVAAAPPAPTSSEPSAEDVLLGDMPAELNYCDRSDLTAFGGRTPQAGLACEARHLDGATVWAYRYADAASRDAAFADYAQLDTDTSGACPTLNGSGPWHDSTGKVAGQSACYQVSDDTRDDGDTAGSTGGAFPGPVRAVMVWTVVGQPEMYVATLPGQPAMDPVYSWHYRYIATAS